jgi:hypothetical protein
MIFPGSFIWNRISNEWLLSTKAAAWLGASALMIMVGFACLEIAPAETTSIPANFLWGALGIGTVFGAFFLWGGMWRYWIGFDSSSRAVRKFWFVLLAGGMWFGAIPYYLFVYLPAVSRLAGSRMDQKSDQPTQSEIRRIYVFRYLLFAGWAVFALALALAIAFPKLFTSIVTPISVGLLMMGLVLATAAYKVLRVYWAGMRG